MFICENLCFLQRKYQFGQLANSLQIYKDLNLERTKSLVAYDYGICSKQSDLKTQLFIKIGSNQYLNRMQN